MTISLLDNLQPGQEVTVTFDIRGREYNGRYFNNLQGWKISTPGDQPENLPGIQFSAPSAAGQAEIEDDDIPF